MSSASKSNILPRVGESSTNATSGGDTSIFATDSTDQKFSHNKNDLIFYDVNTKNTLLIIQLGIQQLIAMYLKLIII